MKKIIFLVLMLINIVGLGYCISTTDFSDKIVFEGFGDYREMSNSDEIESIIKEDEIDIVNVIIVGKTNFYFNVETKENMTSEEADKIQAKRRKAGEVYYKEFNQKLFDSLPKYDYKNLYISKYFPRITFEISSDELFSKISSLLNEIASCEMVETVYVQKPSRVVETMLDSQLKMGVYDDVASGSLTGQGVRVGIIESGIIDVDNYNFRNITAVTRDEWYYIESETDHATAMASCIAGAEGIARNASIYSVELFGDPTGELDWLIDQGVNVINCSYGYEEPNGIYSSHSAAFDYTIWTYGVTVIAASGNESAGQSDYYVSNPGLAYNVITVGGQSNRVLPCTFSCFKEETYVDKPTITNFAEDIILNNANRGSGTSYACALTTGCVALLMEYCPELKSNPAKVTALLAASSYHVSGTYDSTSGLDNIVGAGLFDYACCKASINNCINVMDSVPGQIGDYVVDQRIYLEAGNKVRIAVAWSGKSGDSVDTWQTNNYTLCLFRPTGAQIACSYSFYNNVLLIDYDTQYTGNYRLILILEDIIHTFPTDIFIYYSVRPLN